MYFKKIWNLGAQEWMLLSHFVAIIVDSYRNMNGCVGLQTDTNWKELGHIEACYYFNNKKC